MAEVVPELPGTQQGLRDGDNTWRKYLDGQVWKLKPGEDFHGTINMGRGGFLTACRHQGFQGATRFVDGFLYVQAFPDRPARSYTKKARKPKNADPTPRV